MARFGASYLVAAILVAGLPIQAKTAQAGTNRKMTQDEASNLNLSLISPILEKMADDPQQNANLRIKIHGFVYLLRKGVIFYSVSPALFPTPDPSQQHD